MLKRIISAVIIGATLAVFLLQSTSALTKSEYEQYEKKGVITKLLQSGAIDDIIATHATQNYGQLGEILLAYDYINGTKRFSEFLTAKKNYFAEFKKADDKEIFTDSTNERFDIEVKKSHKTLSFLPKTMLDDGHWAFVYNGLKNDKTFVSNVKQISKDVGMNPNLVFASILTEQTRYSATERWFMKKFLNSKAPFLFSMTSQSYGVGGIKSFTAEKISRDAVEYGYGDSFKGYVGKTGETFWKPILTKKYEEARFPTILIKNILTRWSNAGFSLEGKPGVVVTLYNFGNLEDKKPNASPKIGGAEIKLGSKTYYFGGLGEAFYWQLQLYDKL